MITKKHVLILSSYNNLYSPTCINTPRQSKTSCRRTGRHGHSPPFTRRYATAHEKPSSSYGEDDFSWPLPVPPHTIVTPYQVLQLQPGAPYSKHCFYHLVKLYHPDRTSYTGSHPHVSDLPESERLERYHLIVAAHNLLSDQSRRHDYDRYGIGWTGKAAAWSQPYMRRYDGQSWASGANPMRNATWEDWERFYRQQCGDGAKEPQQPVLLSNTAFASLIVLLAALGGIAEATRASNTSKAFVEQHDAVHEKCSQELGRTRQETRGLGKGERIERFLKQRDPQTFDDEKYRKLWLDPDVCTSEGRMGQDQDFFRKFSSPSSR